MGFFSLLYFEWCEIATKATLSGYGSFSTGADSSITNKCSIIVKETPQLEDGQQSRVEKTSCFLHMGLVGTFQKN